MLPAAVYIPFLQMRHYSILSIQVDEIKLFITKQRAPFCVVCEVWKPAEELTVQIKSR